MKNNFKLLLLLIFVFFAGIFVFFQSRSIFGGDAGDLVAAVCTGGVAHPAGYPLFTILGRLANLLPFFTPAWRVSLVSSIPGAATVALVFYLIWKILKKDRHPEFISGSVLSKILNQVQNDGLFILAALIGSGTLAFSYLFWLYASVPELFSLNNLFLMILLVLTLHVISSGTKQSRNFYLFSFVSGLAVFHHYYNLWYVVVLGFFVLWYNRDLWQKKSWKHFVFCFLLFVFGALPYFYVLLTARNYPIISWEDAVNLKNFMSLITRAHYGGFMTQSIALDSALTQRMELFSGGLKLSFQFLSPLGIILIVLGFIYLLTKKRKIFWLFLFLFLGGFLALFYTGFYLTKEDLFGLGMYSRFSLPILVLDGILIGLGSFYLSQRLRKLSHFRSFPYLILLVLLLMPFSFFWKNYSKILALKTDFTAENFGRDMLTGVKSGGIVFLEEDTPVFDSWYVRYCLNEYQDRQVMTGLPLNFNNLKKNFSQIVLKDQDSTTLFSQILQNKKFPVFSNSLDILASGSAIPSGLVWQYYSEDQKVPSLQEILLQNREIWSSFHDPKAGILSWFQPVTLSDTIRIYKESALNVGIYFFNKEEYQGAKEFFERSLNYDADNFSGHLLLGRVYLEQKNCQKAEFELKISALQNPNLLDPYYFLFLNAKDCFSDNQKADNFKKIYEQKILQSQSRLRDLGQ